MKLAFLGGLEDSCRWELRAESKTEQWSYQDIGNQAVNYVFPAGFRENTSADRALSSQLQAASSNPSSVGPPLARAPARLSGALRDGSATSSGPKNPNS